MKRLLGYANWDWEICGIKSFFGGTMSRSKASTQEKELRRMCARCGWDWKATGGRVCKKCGCKRTDTFYLNKKPARPSAMFPTEI